MNRCLTMMIAVVLAAAPAQAQKAAPEAAALAAAKEVIEASGGRAEALKAMLSVKSAYLAQLRGQEPAVIQKAQSVLDKLLDEKNPAILAYVDEMQAAAIEFYATRFTIDELKLIGVFQASPAGVKFRAAVPELMASMTAPMMRFQQGIQRELQTQMQQP